MKDEQFASSPNTGPDSNSDVTIDGSAGSERAAGAAVMRARSPLRTIGRYRLVRLIGEGGMGAVYEAEQDNPQRSVALKLIKSGFATSDLRRRFELEAQVLGRLQHPGIAQIYEAGSVEGDFGTLPYFAMELVAGYPLVNYAAQHKLDTRARLKLVAQICDAVQHAHQRGVVHRDLKPINILVDNAGQAKILDFGVAHIHDDDAQATRQTNAGQIIGTLAYMSPEQVSGDPLEIDTRCDVYALGVILYELLSRRLPFDVSGATLHDAVAVILQRDAAPLGTFDAKYRGDIETIVAKALEKDKRRRYASASDLAADIRRYLDDEPILARPATTMYQLQKFAKRNRGLVAAAAAILVVLLAGVTASSFEAVRARRAEHEALQAEAQSRSERDRAVHAEGIATAERDRSVAAERTATAERDRAVRAETQAKRDRDLAIAETRRADSEAATATAINNFLQDDLLAQASAVGQRSGAKPDPDITVRTVLDRAAAGVAGKFKDRPQVESSIEKTIGLTYDRLGLYPQSEQHLERALEVARTSLGAQNPRTLAIEVRLGETYRTTGKYPQAEAMMRQAVEGYAKAREAGAAERLEASIALGSVYNAESKYDLAQSVLVPALSEARQKLGPDHDVALEAMSNLARVYFVRGKSSEAEQLLQAMIASYTRKLGPEHPLTVGIMNNLAVLYQRGQRYAEAEAIYTRVLDLERRGRGPDHPETLNVMNNLGVLYSAESKYADAEAMFEPVLAGWRKSLGPEHPRVLALLANLGVLRQSEGKNAEAEALFRQVLDARTRTLGKDHIDTIDTDRLLGILYEAEGKYAEAEPLILQVYEARRRILGPRHPDTLASQTEAGELRVNQGRFSEAEPLLRESLAAEAEVMPADYRRYFTEAMLGAALAGEKRYAEAEPLLVSGFEGMRQRLPKLSAVTRSKLRKAGEQLATVYESLGNAMRASEIRKEVAAIPQQ